MTGPDALVDRMAVLIAATHERVTVIAEDRLDIEVDGNAKFTELRDSLTIEAVGNRLEVRVPEGTDVVIGTTSARAEIRGQVGNAAVTTESGRISIEGASSVDARTISGRVELGQIEGDCRVRSENGRVNVQSCAAADVATTHGSIRLDAADGITRAHCVNGRIDIEMAGAHDVFAETVSGRIDVSLPAGTNAFKRGATFASSDYTDRYDCVVDVRSTTGRVSVSVR
ncbi:MAG: hypothetical protein DRJ50_03780 [Actinobacteria bacterium]|nr:MAG: hypothetical protein DRJ50_03780 [Actinomycetota bacterium]